MANDKIDFVLNLDSEEFASKISDAAGSITKLQEGLGRAASVAGLLGTAFLAVKTSLDIALESERLQSLETQFRNIAGQAGVAADAILTGMDKASDGLLDASDSMELANKAMVQLGSSAGRIPEIMELARRASVLNGSNIASEFEKITLAVSTGQSRALKEFGVNGTGASNIISQLHQRLDGVDTSIRGVSDSSTRFKNALNDIWEAAAKTGIANSFRDAWTGAFNAMADAAKSFATAISATFGTGDVKAQALRDRVAEISGFLAEEEKKPKELINTASIEAQKTKLKELKEELQGLYRNGAKDELAKNFSPSGGSGFGPNAGEANAAKERLQSEKTFFAELRSLKDAEIQRDLATESTSLQVEQNMQEQRLAIVAASQARIAEFEANAGLSPEQKAQARVAIEADMLGKIEALNISTNDRIAAARQRELANMEKGANSVGQGLGNSFKAGGQRASDAMKDFDARGKRAFQSFENNATSALLAFGEGTKSAAEAAKGFIFGMLADHAEAEGKLMLLSAFKLGFPNPAQLAAGAGLIALAGFLRSQAGGRGSTGGVSGGGSSINPSPQPGDDAAQVAQEREKKSLHIIIHGNVFDSKETGMRIIDMMKEVQDVTDISVTR